MGVEAARIERRTLERASTVAEVLAPASWTDARVEAWLDWLDEASDLPAAVFRYAEELVQRGDALNLFETARARSGFRRDLGAAMLAGQVALVGPRSDLAPPTVLAADPGPALTALRSRHRGRALE